MIVIKDQSDKIIAPFKTNKNISNLLYIDENLDYKSIKIYSGWEIDVEETNGLYTEINNYTNVMNYSIH